MKKRYVAAIVIIVLALGLVIAAILMNRSKGGSGNNADDTLVTFEGQVTQINHPEGACLSYQLGAEVYVVAECPDMEGQRGFAGNYDKSIAVGDKVTVRGHPRSTSRATHQTYHLEKSGTYMQLVKHSDSQGSCLALECGNPEQ